MDHSSSGLRVYLVLAQAFYYILTGVWPLISITSFQKVTGPKVDLWLVKTVGVLILVIGSTLGVAGIRRKITPEIALLGLGSAAGMATIDFVYVARKRISSVYLLDATAECIIAAGWLLLKPREKSILN